MPGECAAQPHEMLAQLLALPLESAWPEAAPHAVGDFHLRLRTGRSHVTNSAASTEVLLCTARGDFWPPTT